MAKIWGGNAVVMAAWVKFENPVAFPPFPAWEGVLATKIGDVGRTPHSTNYGEEVDEVTKSITECYGFAVPDFASKETVS